MRFARILIFVVLSLSCGQVHPPVAPREVVETQPTSAFGFEISMPTGYLNLGWEAYSWQPENQRDRYRSLMLNRRLVVIVARPAVDLGTQPYRSAPEGRIPGGTTAPTLRIRVYDDIPSLTFEAIADTLRTLSQKVLDWELNGAHIKEIVGDHPGIYGHTGANVPRIIARANGYLYCLYYSEHEYADVQQVVAGFKLTDRDR